MVLYWLCDFDDYWFVVFDVVDVYLCDLYCVIVVFGFEYVCMVYVVYVDVL